MNNLEEDIANELGMQMQKEVDREILWGMLKELGWTRVTLSRLQDNKHAIDISYWIEEYCTGAYEREGRDFIFENPKDASMFILKWFA
jgi:hypothetical protein